MLSRRLLVVAAALLLGLAAFFLLRNRVGGPARSAAAVPAPVAPPSAPPRQPTPAVATAVADSPIADALNAPDGTIRRDIEILHELMSAFQTNFPRLGNPVGENAEITAALTGANPAKFVFLSPRHRAINARGELCDRWGTPFRFHQLSGTQMEIRSAGPDRKFATADDAEFNPWPK
ncbi:MAG: hypothetical protein NTV51_12035 [Verrucomicrobia bacterium]|nr:hypothetical protein [Verrucomicrobiota bacterium]